MVSQSDSRGAFSFTDNPINIEDLLVSTGCICYQGNIVSEPAPSFLPPHSDPILAELIAQLQHQLDAQARQLDTQALQLDTQARQMQSDASALQYAQLKIKLLEERLRQQRIAKYGKGSEKLSDLQLELLELEPGVSIEEVAAESERVPLSTPATAPEDKTQRKSARKHLGRQTLPAHLERVEKIVTCSPAQCTCGSCGRDTIVIGYEESEQLDVSPAKYFVLVTRREKRACRKCEEQGVVVAPVPERILAKSLVSDQVLLDTIVAKYCDSMPLYRQSAMLKRDTGLDLCRSTMSGWVMQVGDLLQPVVRVMHRDLLEGSYIQADETPVGVQMHDKRGKNHQAYLWQYGSPGGSVVFDFRMGRERDGPKQFLRQFNGILQTDGYAAYDRIGGPKMVHACCLAHARRKYVDALKVDPRDHDSACIVKLMDDLFAIDAAARIGKMNRDERHGLRREKAPALLIELRTQILTAQKRVLPKSLAGKAASYTLALWSKLTLFLEHPELELSNNLAENSMRPIAIGRRNWTHLGSAEAGPKVAAIFSVVESCRRLGLPIRQYLADILPGLANRTIQSLGQLTPSAYMARKAN
jgi:transposase